MDPWSTIKGVYQMLRFAAAAVAVALGAATVYAQNPTVIKQRREAMQAVGGASASAWAMYKGEAPFDLAKVQSALKAMQDQLGKFKDLFPDNSKEGGGTDAKPLIWSDRAGFNGAIDASVVVIKKASEEIKDEASFKGSYGRVPEACGGCHKVDGGYTIRLGESFKKPKP